MTSNSALDGLDNKELESSVLGYFINHASSPADRIKLSELPDDTFWCCSSLFRVMKQLVQDGKEPTALAIREKDKEIAADYLADVMMEACISNIDQYLEQLKDYADVRWAVGRMSKIKERLNKEKARKVIAELSTEIIQRLRQSETETTTVKDIMPEFEAEQKQNIEAVKKRGHIGIPFGYQALDSVISGIRVPHYIIIKAATSVGKSALLLNILHNMLFYEGGKRLLLFSLEMSKFQNISRLIGIRTGLDVLEIEKGTFYNEQIELEAKANIYQQDLSIYESKYGIDDIILTCHAEHAIKPLDCIFLDYLQNISLTDNRYESYTDASQKLQKLAKALKVPIIAASQLGGDGKTRGSGDIDNHANFTIKLSKREEKGEIIPGELVMEVVKNRHGMVNSSIIKFNSGGQLYESIVNN